MRAKLYWTRRHAFSQAEEETMCNHPEYPHNHSHKCDGCGKLWCHSEKSLSCRECHTCPNCGETQFTIHEFASPAAEAAFDRAKGIDREELLFLATLSILKSISAAD